MAAPSVLEPPRLTCSKHACDTWGAGWRQLGRHLRAVPMVVGPRRPRCTAPTLWSHANTWPVILCGWAWEGRGRRPEPGGRVSCAGVPADAAALPLVAQGDSRSPRCRQAAAACCGSVVWGELPAAVCGLLGCCESTAQQAANGYKSNSTAQHFVGLDFLCCRRRHEHCLQSTRAFATREECWRCK